MAGTSSKWTTLGSNTNSTINTDTDDEANIDNTQAATGASGTNNQVRHECHVWLVDGADTDTYAFDWAVNTDFTVVVNSAKQTLALDPGNVTIEVIGSVDGENYVSLHSIATWDAGTSTVGHGIYDLDSYGKMPYMALRLDASISRDNSAKPIKINVFNHL